MSVTITSGERQRKAGTFSYLKTYTQSTSTTPQALDISADAHELGMGTATGSALRNLYTLAAGIEGQQVFIYSNATGEANVVFSQTAGRLPFHISMVGLGGTATAVDAGWASATGQYVFQAAGEYLRATFFNDVWEVNELRGATFATTT